MTHFNGPSLLITLDAPTGGVLSLSVEINLYSEWKEWVIGRYFFNTSTDVNGTTELITYTDHSLHTGQAVVYYTDLGTDNIGLVNGTEYFVRADDATGDRNTFELYDTEANAEAGPATTGRLDLTAAGGPGETHRFAADNAKFIESFRTIGGDPLSPGVDAGPYFFLQNQVINGGTGWRIISTDEDQTINYQGNLVAEAPVLQLINVTPGRSVLHLGLQPITQRVDEILSLGQTAEYQGSIWIDTINGSAGIVYPAGTPQEPVNNLANAITIANTLSFENFKLRGTITPVADFSNFSVDGVGVDVTDIIVLNGQVYSGCRFSGVSVSGGIGALTNDVNFEDCRVGNVTNFRGSMKRCGLSDTITFAPGQSNILACYTEGTGGGGVELNLNGGNAVDLFVRGMVGVFSLADSSNVASVMSVDLGSGEMTIVADILQGIISVRGVGTYNNNSLLTVNDVGLIDQKDVRLIKQMTSGNATVSVDDLSVTVYDEDGVTVLATFSLSADGRIRTRLT